MTDDLQRVAGPMARLLRSMGGPSPDAMDVIFHGWAKLVGPQLAQHCVPTRLVDGRLTVTVAEPTYATHMKFLGPSLIERINVDVGSDVVTEVIVKVRRR